MESLVYLTKSVCHWQSIESIDYTFPCLRDDYLRSITFGIYQLSQAPHYADQHLCKRELDINKTSHDYIRGKIQSKHTSARKYFLWIKINQGNLQDPVVGWYWECKAGEPTVDCSAHVTTIMWYLGKRKHAQYKPNSDTFSTTV